MIIKKFLNIAFLLHIYFSIMYLFSTDIKHKVNFKIIYITDNKISEINDFLEFKEDTYPPESNFFETIFDSIEKKYPQSKNCNIIKNTIYKLRDKEFNIVFNNDVYIEFRQNFKYIDINKYNIYYNKSDNSNQYGYILNYDFFKKIENIYNKLNYLMSKKEINKILYDEFNNENYLLPNDEDFMCSTFEIPLKQEDFQYVEYDLIINNNKHTVNREYLQFIKECENNINNIKLQDFFKIFHYGDYMLKYSVFFLQYLKYFGYEMHEVLVDKNDKILTDKNLILGKDDNLQMKYNRKNIDGSHYEYRIKYKEPTDEIFHFKITKTLDNSFTLNHKLKFPQGTDQETMIKFVLFAYGFKQEDLLKVEQYESGGKGKSYKILVLYIKKNAISTLKDSLDISYLENNKKEIDNCCNICLAKCCVCKCCTTHEEDLIYKGNIKIN